MIFNGVTEKFFMVSDSSFPMMKQIVLSPEKYMAQYPQFLSKLQKSGFVVDESVDELHAVRLKHEGLLEGEEYRLMVLPTYSCNLRCWYCTQDHRNVTMDKELVARVGRHIEKYLFSHQGIRRFHLSWFGGEPLLVYDTVCELTRQSRDTCKKLGVEFSCHMTTNATLLNERRVETLGALGVTSFQITVDGCRDLHDRVKTIHNGSSYDRIIRNVCHIARLIPDSTCFLRYNYTAENLDADHFVSELCSSLPMDVRQHLQLDVCKVWQESPLSIDTEHLSRIFDDASRHGFHPQASFCGLCYADHSHFATIFPNGRVGKCDNLDMDSLPGTLEEDGDIVWHGDVEYLRSAIFERGSVCRECRHLPICWGPCPMKRERMHLAGQVNTCLYVDADNYFLTEIRNRCSQIMRRVTLESGTTKNDHI